MIEDVLKKFRDYYDGQAKMYQQRANMALVGIGVLVVILILVIIL